MSSFFSASSGGRVRALALVCLIVSAGLLVWHLHRSPPIKETPPMDTWQIHGEIWMHPFSRYEAVSELRSYSETVELGWFQRDGLEDEIAAWEQATGFKVPPAYRDFLLFFNGGYPYPDGVRIDAVPSQIYPSRDRIVPVPYFNDWELVLKTWNKEAFAYRAPPDMLDAVAGFGGLHFFVSVAPETWGQVFAWPSAYGTWGSPQNNRLYYMAPDFNAFLRLFKPREKSFYHWYVPELAPLIRRYKIPD